MLGLFNAKTRCPKPSCWITKRLNVLLCCLYDFKYFTYPKILGHAAMSWFIAPFLKIYGDGPALSKWCWHYQDYHIHFLKLPLHLNLISIVKHLSFCWSHSQLLSHYLTICRFNDFISIQEFSLWNIFSKLALALQTWTYLSNKIRVQGKARNGEKAEHTLSMWAFWTVLQHCRGHLDCFYDRF